MPTLPRRPALPPPFAPSAPAAASTGDPADDPADGTRRRWLQAGGLALAGVGALGPLLAGCAAGTRGASARADTRLGFTALTVDDTANGLRVPPGYRTQVLAPWGDPVGLAGLAPGRPAFRPDASNSADEQAQQFGMHHDGLHFYPLDARGRRGVLAMNHEYVDDGLLHRDGAADWSAQKVRKAQAAHGISVCEVALLGGHWQVVAPSPLARRITASTPCVLGGPAAGHVLLRTADDPAGRTVLGTLANCAAGRTPWGTYLSGEENWAGYFDGGADLTADQRRYGLRREGWSRWAAHDPRFDARRHPHEFHRFGWVVELDPLDPQAPPVKRTALGRGAHEGAWVAMTQDGRAVVYSGEDAAFECIYKFVSRDRVAPAAPGVSAARANATLLDHGTLHVARFDADGTGRWLPLLHGQGPLVPANGFADAAEVLIKRRQAAQRVGGTPMDRPEWLAIDPRRREVLCTLTGNAQRGVAPAPAVDAANPRAANTMGHIVRWREDGDFDAASFTWNHLLLAGDPANPREEARGTVRGDAFACPDGIAFDTRGVLWIQTDVPRREQGQGEFARLGNNQMLACDPATGEVRRFLTGPAGCEITGLAFTPDGRAMFVNVQHPGETPGDHSDPANPARFSSWPDLPPGGRPRSATVVVTRHDGGVIGA